MMDDMTSDPSLLKYKPEQLRLLDALINAGLKESDVKKIISNPGLVKTFFIMVRNHDEENLSSNQ